MPTATVKLVGPDGMPKVFCSTGTGPVDAAYKAVDMAMQIPVELLNFEMQSVTEGIDALAVCKVRARVRTCAAGMRKLVCDRLVGAAVQRACCSQFAAPLALRGARLVTW